MFTTTGTFRYSPTIRGDSTTRRDGGSTLWWLVIDCDPELGRYLRAQYARHRHLTVTPQPPLWGAHVSVIRGEEPPDKTAWKKFDGRHVEVRYGSEVTQTHEYLWVAVSCSEAEAIRVELGLAPQPDPPMHLTFGNLKG